jgi:hypothetical protein
LEVPLQGHNIYILEVPLQGYNLYILEVPLQGYNLYFWRFHCRDRIYILGGSIAGI